jgi:hypothetical protein
MAMTQSEDAARQAVDKLLEHVQHDLTDAARNLYSSVNEQSRSPDKIRDALVRLRSAKDGFDNLCSTFEPDIERFIHELRTTADGAS